VISAQVIYCHGQVGSSTHFPSQGAPIWRPTSTTYVDTYDDMSAHPSVRVGTSKRAVVGIWISTENIIQGSWAPRGLSVSNQYAHSNPKVNYVTPSPYQGRYILLLRCVRPSVTLLSAQFSPKTLVGRFDMK
jgi:hypothetical protein